VSPRASVSGRRHRLSAPNHDIAVTNKFCEYLAAGLPIVTSDTLARATLVRELGLGVVYTAGDPHSLDSLDAR
jgi:glycosyltransferase involved in cell wall biosynthesis